MKYFLIVYEQSSGTITTIREFEEGQRAQASSERAELEALHRDESDIEIVVLASASLDSLKKTHGRYFKSVGEIASEA